MLLRADETRVQGILHRKRKSTNDFETQQIVSKSVLEPSGPDLDYCDNHDTSAPILR